VSGVVATPGIGSVSLAWTLGGMSTFRIKRSTTSDMSGATTLTSSASSSPYSDTGRAANTTYYYTVEASNGTWGTASATASALTAPAQVTGLAATNGDTQSVLTWSAVTGSTGYLVYKNGTLLATLGNVLTYTATGLTNGTGYTFTVAATNGTVGTPSAGVTATPAASVTYIFQDEHDDTTVASWWTRNRATLVTESGGKLNLIEPSGAGNTNVTLLWPDAPSVPASKKFRLQTAVTFATDGAYYSMVGMRFMPDGTGSAGTLWLGIVDGTLTFKLWGNGSQVSLSTAIAVGHEYAIEWDVDLNSGGHTTISIDGAQKYNALTTNFLGLNSYIAGVGYCVRVGMIHEVEMDGADSLHKVNYSRLIALT